MMRYSVLIAYENQIKFCKNNNLPIKIPLNAKCPNCNKGIFTYGGVNTKQASEEHIKACPFCYFDF